MRASVQPGLRAQLLSQGERQRPRVQADLEERADERDDERTVAKYYEYGMDRFWRHLAVETCSFEAGESWYLGIRPKYFFTEDGETPCDGELAGPYTTSLKADEHNSQVLNHVLFWADVLSPQNIASRFGWTARSSWRSKSNH